MSSTIKSTPILRKTQNVSSVDILFPVSRYSPLLPIRIVEVLCSKEVSFGPTHLFRMDTINDLVEAYDAAEGRSTVQALKELLKELRRSKVNSVLCI